MNSVCIDNSFLINLLTGGQNATICQEYWEGWQSQNIQIVAPYLIYYEACNVLYRMQKYQQIPSAQAILSVILEMDIYYYNDFQLHYQALKLAQMFQLSAAYDAHYLALAERLNIDFYTCDKKLFNAIQQNFSNIHLVS